LEVDQMEVIVERAGALDIHKKSITACVRTPDGQGGRAEQVRTYSAFLGGLESLRGWLLAERVSHVAMEATSSYWLPVWRVLEEPAETAGPDAPGPFELLLCNARHVKHVPGRKTDVKDAAWLAQLCEVGLLHGSFVPPPEIRRLRVVTRYRKRLTQLRTSEVQRVEKTLEDAVVKLGSVASSTLTKSGRAMIEALIAGERDPEVLAELSKARLRNKIPELEKALDSRFEDHHAVQLRQLLDHIDWFDATIEQLNGRIATMTQPWAEVIDRLQSIPGVGRRTAEVIIAETGGDMARFPDHQHLASWAGLCPGHNESGGKRRSGKTNPGNVWLADALTEAAWAAIRTKDTYLQAKFWRVAGPRADSHRKAKAAIAVAHKLLIAAYYIMGTPNETYRELGGDHFTSRDNPERHRDRLVAQLTKLGYDVDLTPAAAA
jgi:transposase